MTAGAPPVPVLSTLPAAPGHAVTRLAMRQVRRGAFVVAAVAAVMSAVVAEQYQSTFKAALDGSALRALVENPAIRILFGTPVALDDPGGFTVWRTGTPVLILAGVWVLLCATRITRGEEDTGRWDLLLAGRLRVVDLVMRCLTVLTGSAVLIAVAIAAGLLIAGTNPRGVAVYAVGVLGATCTYAAVGVLAAQILPSRASAVGLGVAVLGAGLLARMLADGVAELAWLRWATPFGLMANAAPFAQNRIGPLVVLNAFPFVLGVAALALAGRRDVGGGLVVVRTSRPPRTLLLGSISAFAARRAIQPTIGWASGLAAYFLFIGALIASILQFFEENRHFADLAASAGFSGLNSVHGFVAAMCSLLAIPVGLYAVTRLVTMAADEKERRWTALYAAPVSRTRLVGNEIAVTAAGTVVLLVTAAVAVWIGAVITGAPLGLRAALAGALNTVPIAWLGLGAAALALGWLPRAVGIVGALPVAGGFLLDVITKSAQAPSWLGSASPFAHLAAVPDVPVDWAATITLTVIAAVLGGLGVLGYSVRDLNT